MQTSEKTCGRCGEVKPLTNFYPQTGRKRGLSFCKSCQAKAQRGTYSRRREKGPVPEGHVCPICFNGHGVKWHLDHDHETGAVRDYLCRGCNTNLDRYTGSHWLAPAAAAYLARHSGAPVCTPGDC